MSMGLILFLKCVYRYGYYNIIPICYPLSSLNTLLLTHFLWSNRIIKVEVSSNYVGIKPFVCELRYLLCTIVETNLSIYCDLFEGWLLPIYIFSYTKLRIEPSTIYVKDPTISHSYYTNWRSHILFVKPIPIRTHINFNQL